MTDNIFRKFSYSYVWTGKMSFVLTRFCTCWLFGQMIHLPQKFSTWPWWLTGYHLADNLLSCIFLAQNLHMTFQSQCHWSLSLDEILLEHDDVIKWKHFPRYWPFVRGIHRSTVNSSYKGQWRGALIFSLICAWIDSWINNREGGDLGRYRSHYDVTAMIHIQLYFFRS